MADPCFAGLDGNAPGGSGPRSVARLRTDADTRACAAISVISLR